MWSFSGGKRFEKLEGDQRRKNNLVDMHGFVHWVDEHFNLFRAGSKCIPIATNVVSNV